MSNEDNYDLALILDHTGWALNKARRSERLSDGDWAFLRYLDTAPPELANVKYAAWYNGWSVRHARHYVERLQRSKHVQSFDNPADKRQSILELTAKGAEALKTDPAFDIGRKLAIDCNPNELPASALALRSLLEAFADAGLRARTALYNACTELSSDLNDASFAIPATAAAVREDERSRRQLRAVGFLCMLAAQDTYNAMSSAGLRRAEWQALRVFGKAGPAGASRSQIVEKAHSSASAAADMINPLIRLGLLRRQSGSAGNAGGVSVITAKGAEKLTQDPARLIAAVLDNSLSTQERQRVLRLMSTINASCVSGSPSEPCGAPEDVTRQDD